MDGRVARVRQHRGVAPHAVAAGVVLALLGVACKPGPSDSANAPRADTAKATDAAKPVADAGVSAVKGIVAGAGLSAATAGKEGRTPVLDFSVPRTVAVGTADTISFVIQSAAVEPRNPDSVRVVLLMRLSNRGAYPTNFWDASFRLVAHDAVIPASGGLNALVDARSDSALERVQFVVPMSSVPRALRIEHGGETVELPLRFT